MSNLNLKQESSYSFISAFIIKRVINEYFLLFIVMIFSIGIFHGGLFHEVYSMFGLAFDAWLILNMHTAYLAMTGKVTKKEIGNSVLVSIPVLVIIFESLFLDAGWLGEKLSFDGKNRTLFAILFAAPLFAWISVMTRFPSIRIIKWLTGIVTSAWYAFVGEPSVPESEKRDRKPISTSRNKDARASLISQLPYYGFQFAGMDLEKNAVIARLNGALESSDISALTNSLGLAFETDPSGETLIFLR